VTGGTSACPPALFSCKRSYGPSRAVVRFDPLLREHGPAMPDAGGLNELLSDYP
jgi:hypothetical protein